MNGVQFRAGFARVDITPPLGVPVVGYFGERFAKEVLDPLEASALAVSDGENTAVLIAADLLGIEGTAFSSVLRSRIASAAGIADNAVFLHCTHTHTGPGAGVADEGRCHLFDGTSGLGSEFAKQVQESLAGLEITLVAVEFHIFPRMLDGISDKRRMGYKSCFFHNVLLADLYSQL